MTLEDLQLEFRSLILKAVRSGLDIDDVCSVAESVLEQPIGDHDVMGEE